MFFHGFLLPHVPRIAPTSSKNRPRDVVWGSSWHLLGPEGFKKGRLDGKRKPFCSTSDSVQWPQTGDAGAAYADAWSHARGWHQYDAGDWHACTWRRGWQDADTVHAAEN